MRDFSLIVSCAENRVMGRAGRLPWRIPEDQAFFHRQTAGQIVIMGRICFQAWPRASFDGRKAIVLTNERSLGAGVHTVTSLAEAWSVASGLSGEIYVCGGEAIYAEAMARPEASRLFLTLVHAEVPGDRYFPEWKSAFPREIARRESADPNWRYTFLQLARAPAPGIGE